MQGALGGWKGAAPRGTCRGEASKATQTTTSGVVLQSGQPSTPPNKVLQQTAGRQAYSGSFCLRAFHLRQQGGITGPDMGLCLQGSSSCAAAGR